MQIIKQSQEFTKQQLYSLIYKNSITLKELEAGEEFEVAAWVIYEAENYTGDLQEICATMSRDGRIIAFQSPTSINSLTQAWEFFGEDIKDGIIFRKVSGKSKAGRDYVDIEFVNLI